MKKKVLVIDDDIITLKIIKKHLDETFDVQLENEGYRFVEKMNAYDADLILLDMDMPIMNGMQVLEAISKNQKFANTPVAFLSGVYSPELVHSVMSKGASGYIVKTLPKSEMLTQIANIMAKTIHRSFTPDVVVLESDIDMLKEYKHALEDVGMKAKVLPTLMSAAEYLKSHNADAFVIGSEVGGQSPEYIKEQLAGVLSHSTNVICVKQPLAGIDLAEKVREALG